MRVSIEKSDAAEEKSSDAEPARGRRRAESSSSPLTQYVSRRKSSKGRGASQSELRVSEPGDASELEAERLAERVLSAQPPGSPTDAAAARPAVIQRAAEDSRAPVNAREPVVPRGGGDALPARARDFFEPRFGRDLGDVRVHTGADAAHAAKALAARGYAVGNHLVFGAGQFAPGTPAGDRLLAHELAHVVFGAHEPVVHRAPDPAFDIEVPDPDDLSFDPGIQYPWQNPSLRGIIYPYRDELLSYFLRTYMEIDLDDPAAAQNLKAPSVEEWKAERAKLGEQLKEVGEKIKEAEKEMKEAEKAKNPDKYREVALRARPLYFRRHRLEEDLKYLPAPGKKDALPANAAKKWATYQYSKYDDKGAELAHDDLLARILDRFDADTTFTRYPKWLRYMVIHFSGMRYESAHGSYAPASKLVQRLKQEQVKSEMGAASELEIESFAADAVTDVQDELDDPANKPKPARARDLKSRLKELKAVETASAAAFSKKGQETQRTAFTELLRLEHERDASEWELDEPLFEAAAKKKLAELAPLIKEAEAKINPKLLGQARQSLKAAQKRRRAAVVEHELEKAAADLATLDDMQAVAVLKAMHDEGAFPDWVWRKIVRVTPLKLEVEEGEDWEKRSPEELELERVKPKDPITARWKSIMDEWLKNSTGWRERHGQDLSLVVIRAVCNEISEMSMHARGLQPAGGIGQKTRWYAGKGSGGSFSRPKSNADLKPGASLFWLEWSYTPAKYPAIHIVGSDTVELKSDKGELISDGLTDADGWTYKFHADQHKSVTRSRVIVPRPVIVTAGEAYATQYLLWKHEAQIVEVDAKNKRVLTFETGPIGLRTRALESVVNAWDVYVGFAPSGREPADIDEYLKNILPGR